MARKKKLDTETAPETPRAASDTETAPETPRAVPDKEPTTDSAWVPKFAVGIWEFGVDGLTDQPAVISNSGNWIWRRVSGEQLAQHASDMAELARQMIDAGH